MIEHRLQSWFEATGTRRSRRAYRPERAEPATLDALAATCEGFHPYPDARVVVVTDPATDIFTGVIGSYGKVSGAPHLLCMIADERSPSSALHVGYVGEAAVLEATALGLSTCWVGGFFDPKKASLLVRTGPSERIVAVSPVGAATPHLSRAERTLRSLSAARHRKPLERLALGDPAAWPAWAQAALECARIAPSAVNRQPWRFRFADGQLELSQDSPLELPRVTKALDCGIAMLHAELGAWSCGVRGTWHDTLGNGTLARFLLREGDR